MTSVEVLRAARALYAANPSHAPATPNAGTYCAVTAMWHASDGRSGYNTASDVLYSVTGVNDLSSWNAKSSTAEVLAAFDRAIELAEAQA